MFKLIETPGMVVCFVQHISLKELFWYDTCISVQHNRKTGGHRGDESQIQATAQDILGNTVGG